MPPKSQPAATAQEQIRNLRESVLDGNEARFVAGFAIDDQEEDDLVRKYFRVLWRFTRLHNAVVTAFGPDSWARLQEKTNGRDPDSTVQVSLPSITREESEHPASLSPIEKSNSFRYAGFGPAPLVLRPSVGGWLARPSFEGVTVASLSDSMTAITRVLDKYISRLQDNPEAFEKFRTDFASDLVAAMLANH